MSDAPRKPLVPFGTDVRRRLLYAQGLDEECLPLNLTDAERRAAREPGLPARQEKSMTPLIPTKWVAVAVAIATALAAAAAFAPKLTFLPPWVGFTLWALAVVAALLAGVALPAFNGAAPAVPATLVPFFLTAASALAGFASTLAPGTWQTVVMFAAILCAGLGGKALPPPMTPPASLPGKA